MATVLTIQLPTGFTRTTGGPCFDNVRVGKPGNWRIVQQSPYAYWQFTVNYKRSEIPAKFDEVYRFFLVTGAAFAFLVDDRSDNSDSSQGGSGVVELVGSNYRLMKHYPSGSGTYVHPITRPKAGIVLGGGAAGGTLDLDTGIVTGISAAGTWVGEFYRLMIFLEDKFEADRTPGMAVQVMNVQLQEQLEL